MLAVVAGPCLYFTAFILFASKQGAWVLVPLVLGITLGLCFPVTGIASPEQPKPARGFLSLLRAAAFALTTYWVLHLPEASALLDRLLEGALWDWKPITAAGIATLLSMHSGRQRVSLLSDEMIFRYYETPREEMEQG